MAEMSEEDKQKLIKKVEDWLAWDKNETTRADIAKLYEEKNFKELAVRMNGRLLFGTAARKRSAETWSSSGAVAAFMVWIVAHTSALESVVLSIQSCKAVPATGIGHHQDVMQPDPASALSFSQAGLWWVLSSLFEAISTSPKARSPRSTWPLVGS
ncbi:unnamed protein product [Strongylus vulgaris]|uniref:Uncharacterized protein n=1 Tax=Strongylus vulgaris TaxID=40348 RepID=A0A3P7JG13_STRVU|nr:unnamed protein product [Strongylus vulgaris]